MISSERLHVVTCVANPVRWASRISLYREFAAHMLDSGVTLTTVECAFGERRHELADVPNVTHIPVRASGSSLCWSKESLLNIGITRLPPDANYIATIDADIRFRSPTWAVDTLQAHQHYDVVQPWSDCYDLGPQGQHLELHRSFCRLVHEDKPIVQGPRALKAPYAFGHPGYAWSYTRRALGDVGLLMDTAALGAADHHQAMALIGRVHDSIPAKLTGNYSIPLKVWQDRATRCIGRNISYVAGTIEHGWHGAKAKRSYVDRWDVLIRHNFDPFTDLRRNIYGIYELAGNKPGLRHDIDLYFRSRNEDSTTLD